MEGDFATYRSQAMAGHKAALVALCAGLLLPFGTMLVEDDPGPASHSSAMGICTLALCVAVPALACHRSIESGRYSPLASFGK